MGRTSTDGPRLAGLNRVIETGLEPVARVIWSPKHTTESDPSPPESLGRERARPPPRATDHRRPKAALEQHEEADEVVIEGWTLHCHRWIRHHDPICHHRSSWTRMVPLLRDPWMPIASRRSSPWTGQRMPIHPRHRHSQLRRPLQLKHHGGLKLRHPWCWHRHHLEGSL